MRPAKTTNRLAVVAAWLLLAGSALAQAPASPPLWLEPGADGQPRVHLYFFWSESCPHCQEAHQKDRRRMLLVGGIFVATSGLMYFAFMAAWLNVVPLLLIVLIFVGTLSAHKLSEREGRLLKLMSGTLMLELGLVLTLAPAWLNSLGVTAALVGGALAVTLLAVRLTRSAGKPV